MRIADSTYAAEDLIESEIVDRILSSTQSQRKKSKFFNCFPSIEKPKNNGEKINIVDLYEGLMKVIEDMDLIKKEVMETFGLGEKSHKFPVVQDQLQRQVSSASASLTRLNSTMVGFDDVSLEIMDKLTDGRLNRHVIPIVGMGGIVTKEILCDLLSKVNKERSEDELGEALYKNLYGRRFLVVLDDMWGIEAWEKIKRYFPNNGNSSRILVTTRLSNLGSQLDSSYSLEMKFLDEVSSWDMFSEIVFKGENCPVELEKIGKKIVESCRGLPLSIVVIGGLLEKLERTKKCWEAIRGNLNSIVNSENDEHCLKILKLSYNHLPVYLKPCFLYMGVFEEDRAIRVSTLIKQWVSEGLLKPISDESLETIAKGYMKELIDRNLIIVDKFGSIGSVKYCKIHDLLRDLCLRESQKQRFYHVVGQQISSPSTSSARRIVVLIGSPKKKVCNAIEYTPCARSYISDHESVGKFHSLRLLRTFRAYDRYYSLSHRYSLEKMFQLVNLRFLAVGDHRCAKLPSSINLLWSLQTLIVFHPKKKVNACVEFWKMSQLRHVRFDNTLFPSSDLGLHLPNPPRDKIVIMENLQTLIGVSNLKCDAEVVRRIPNIKKLGLLYGKDKGSTESHDDNYYCLENIECLHKLESLSCAVDVHDFHFEKLSFPHSLKKLSLRLTPYYDLEDMLAKIGSLPLLEKLILHGVSLRTGTWEVVEGQFPSLKFLSLKWIRDLKEIPREIGEIPTLQTIELEFCSESAVKSMKEIVKEQEDLQGEDLPFKVQVFLEKENEELQKLANPNFQVTAGYRTDFLLFSSCSLYDN